MASSANALQKAVFERLAGDAELTGQLGTPGIFDHRRTGASMPYLVIAEIETRDFGAGLEEHLLTIEAWSAAEGRREAQAVAGRVKTLLHDAALAPSGATLANLQHRATRIRRENRGNAIVAELTFRAVTE